MKSASHSITDKNNRLGRGLDALLGPSRKKDEVLLLDIEKISPNKNQPRTAFNKESLEELCASIKANGVLQPILVQKLGNIYQIIVGERRWRAACMAGLHKIPVIVRQPDLQQVSLWALVENIQRENLSPIEEARTFKKIMEGNNLSQKDLAKTLGRSRPSLANSLRLLQLDKEVQKLVEAKKISFAQAREILRFKSFKEQREIAQACLKKSLTVKKISLKAEGKRIKTTLPFWTKNALSHLEKEFSNRIKLNYSQGGKGSLIFSFKNETEFKNLLNKLWDK